MITELYIKLLCEQTQLSYNACEQAMRAATIQSQLAPALDTKEKQVLDAVKEASGKAATNTAAALATGYKIYKDKSVTFTRLLPLETTMEAHIGLSQSNLTLKWSF